MKDDRKSLRRVRHGDAAVLMRPRAVLGQSHPTPLSKALGSTVLMRPRAVLGQSHPTPLPKALGPTHLVILLPIPSTPKNLDS